MSRLRLRVVMFDPGCGPNLFGSRLPAGAVGIDLDPEVEDRIVQEEAWAQTSWPEGEPSLAELLADHTSDGHRDPGERTLGLDPAEWQAVRRALALAGDVIEDGVIELGESMAESLPLLAAVLRRMGGRVDDAGEG